ncbi:helix-turn-helix domain-containing protein [Aquimarina muelleri]|uniref:Transcriptional regulator n=1 Tax=Aquimarina muelleri TaxID=279356 RepID=A0A918JSS6_9FLAO|nr:helix-turn-helix domain-containing protein [Aquimarina muelleri]MCX2762091.1 helix-turn-helix domain-containing protein [Aquimarina muelleri]GGX04391.1 transcriptional regulator [Aquimarina muelleri]
MKIIDSLFLISGLQTFVISIVLLFFRSKKAKVNRYLGLFFVTLLVEFLLLYGFNVIKHPAIYYVPFRLDFLSMNFLFFYAAETSGIRIKNKFYYYIPAIFEFLFTSVFFIAVLQNPDLHTTLKNNNFFTITRVFASLYIMMLSFLIIRINIKHKKQLPDFYEITKFKSLNWLTIFCVICICFNLFANATRIFPEEKYLSVVSDSIYLLSLYYITIASLVQINIINIISPEEKKRTIAELEDTIKVIEEYMLETKAYLNPSISLKTFANDIKLPERLISKAINRIEHKNFNNYINYYRIEEFKKLLSMDRHKKFSISAIANEVGFNSRASFYKNFKDIVGVSPSIYAKKEKV